MANPPRGRGTLGMVGPSSVRQQLLAQQQQLAAGGSGGGAVAAAEPAAPKPPTQLFSPVNFKNNAGVVYFFRIYVTVVAGAAVGILGVTGWPGFAAYLASQALATLPLVAKAGGGVKRYFTTWSQLAIDHVFTSTAVMSYVLLWMIFYNLCHVF